MVSITFALEYQNLDAAKVHVLMGQNPHDPDFRGASSNGTLRMSWEDCFDLFTETSRVSGWSWIAGPPYAPKFTLFSKEACLKFLQEEKERFETAIPQQPSGVFNLESLGIGPTLDLDDLDLDI